MGGPGKMQSSLADPDGACFRLVMAKRSRWMPRGFSIRELAGAAKGGL